MAMATLTTVTSSKQTMSLENSSNSLRDVSFSSYLSNTEESFVHKLEESSRNLSPIITADDQEVEKNHFLRRKKEEVGEIGVFSAEKYFNGIIDHVNSPRISKIIPKKYTDQPKEEEDEEIIDLVPVKPKLHPVTPSIHSESSWNSQTALLQQNVQMKTLQRETKRANGKSRKNFLAGLGCKCACSDKDSIDVDDEHVGEMSFRKNTNAATTLQAKPITEEIIIKTNHHKPSSLINEEIHSVAGNLEEQRKSLEVFGSPVLQDKKSKSFRIERRLSMLSWDAPAPKRMEETEYSAPSSGFLYKDNESVASSSDLFEIESLTGKLNPFLGRERSDATSGCVTPTTCYAPSEASIEWSVVTASAADFSVMSDYEELRPAAAAANAEASATVEEKSRRRTGILLGCNSTKAVRVAGDAAYRTSDKLNSDSRMRRVSDSYVPVARFPPENKLMGFDSSQRQRALSTLSLPRSHPSQTSHLVW